MAAKETKIAVHVPNREAENPTHALPIHGADPDAIPGIRAFDFVTVDEVDIGLELRQQTVKFADVILTIAIGVENEILLGVLESADQRCPVSQIVFVMDDAKKRQLDGKPIKNDGCLVFASVVH